MSETPTDKALLEKRHRLRSVSEHLPGHGPSHPAEELERVAAYIREHDLRPDVYGAGAYVEAFEKEVAELLGTESARFMPSGCMAQLQA